jgi:hypothetical protein
VPVRHDRLVVPVQPGGSSYPDIEPVKKHRDMQRGIEPIYQSAWPTGPACGRRENAAAESKQISGWFRSTSSTHWHMPQESTSRGMQCADAVAAPAVRPGICFRKAPVAACSAQTQSQHRRYAAQCPRGFSAGSWRQLKTYASQLWCSELRIIFLCPHPTP